MQRRQDIKYKVVVGKHKRWLPATHLKLTFTKSFNNKKKQRNSPDARLNGRDAEASAYEYTFCHSHMCFLPATPRSLAYIHITHSHHTKLFTLHNFQFAINTKAKTIKFMYITVIHGKGILFIIVIIFLYWVSEWVCCVVLCCVLSICLCRVLLRLLSFHHCFTALLWMTANGFFVEVVAFFRLCSSATVTFVRISMQKEGSNSVPFGECGRLAYRVMPNSTPELITPKRRTKKIFLFSSFLPSKQSQRLPFFPYYNFFSFSPSCNIHLFRRPGACVSGASPAKTEGGLRIHESHWVGQTNGFCIRNGSKFVVIGALLFLFAWCSLLASDVSHPSNAVCVLMPDCFCLCVHGHWAWVGVIFAQVYFVPFQPKIGSICGNVSKSQKGARNEVPQYWLTTWVLPKTHSTAHSTQQAHVQLSVPMNEE